MAGKYRHATHQHGDVHRKPQTLPPSKQTHPYNYEIVKIADEINNPMLSLTNSTISNFHRRYDHLKRVSAKSAPLWDCSEFSSYAMNNQVKDLRESGIKMKTNLNAVANAFKTGSTSEYQEQQLRKISHGLTGRKNIMQHDLKPGMVIFMRYPATKGGYTGHVSMVVRDPATGELKIAESIGSSRANGVVMRSLSNFFNTGKASQRSTTMSLYDPFEKDRATLNQYDEEVIRVGQMYREAKNGHGTGLMRVGGRQTDEQIREQIKANLRPSQVGLPHGLQTALNENTINLNALGKQQFAFENPVIDKPAPALRPSPSLSV